jgi:hypothetical protein
LQVKLERPDRSSAKVPSADVSDVVIVLPSVGAVRVSAGGVLSILTVTEALAVFSN